MYECKLTEGLSVRVAFIYEIHKCIGDSLQSITSIFGNYSSIAVRSNDNHYKQETINHDLDILTTGLNSG